MDINHHVLYWPRVSSDVYERGTPFRLRANIGSGIKNLFNLLMFNIWLVWKLVLFRKSFTTMHAIDFDTVGAGLLIKCLLRKRLIFDIYDGYAYGRKFPKFAGDIIKKVERSFASKADSFIVPAYYRLNQMGMTHMNNGYVLENVPVPKSTLFVDYKRSSKFDKNCIVLSYVGTLESRTRGLENLLRLVSINSNYILVSAGYGELAPLFKKFADEFENIFFYGAVDPQRGLEIMLDSDIIVGLYYLNSSNHLYASPNKYYEHLMLGKPILTSNGTRISDLVSKDKTGFTIGDNIEDLDILLKTINKNDILNYSKNAKHIWDCRYKNYYVDNALPLYAKILSHDNLNF